MTSSGGRCWHCSRELTPLDYGRADTCAGCGRDTRVCKACEHYEKGVENDCRESQAERVVEKERSNFCDYFRPSARSNGGLSESQKRDAMKNAAELLFKKPK